MARFNERKQTLYKKCFLMESDFGLQIEMKIKSGNALYCYRSDGWDVSSLPSPTEVQGPGDFMTRNEAIRIHRSSSAPWCSGDLASSDAGHQKHGSVQESSPPVQNRREYEERRPQTSVGLTPNTSSEDDHETPLYQLIQTPNTSPSICSQALGSRSHTPSNQESLGQQRGNESVAMLSRRSENSPSPPKRSYHSMSDLSTEINTSSPLALGAVGTPTVKDEMLSKQKRLKKQESVKTLLSSIPQFVPLPPSLISPLRSTR